MKLKYIILPFCDKLVFAAARFFLSNISFEMLFFAFCKGILFLPVSKVPLESINKVEPSSIFNINSLCLTISGYSVVQSIV